MPQRPSIDLVFTVDGEMKGNPVRVRVVIPGIRWADAWNSMILPVFEPGGKIGFWSLPRVFPDVEIILDTEMNRGQGRNELPRKNARSAKRRISERGAVDGMKACKRE